MADPTKEQGPFIVKARTDAREPEVTVGQHEEYEQARDHAQGMLDRGAYPILNVYDRNNKNVFTPAAEPEKHTAGKKKGKAAEEDEGD